MNKDLISKGFIALAIIVMASIAAYYFIKNPAHTDKKTIPEQKIISVKSRPISLGRYPIKIEVMGQVTPARSAVLKPQISGKIISVDREFIEGGVFKENAQILQIDPSDYEIDVKIKQATVAQANAALNLELGQQEIARDELKIIEQSTGRKLDNDSLALRKPQLEQAKASLDSAKAQLDFAKLNLKRTKITAPFDGIITQRNTDIGNIVTPQNVMATLVATDEYWIDIEIAAHDIKWLEIGARAVITLNNGLGVREGKLLKITGSLNKNSRLASMIITVKQPLSGTVPLMIGDYVHVTLIGAELENTARIPTKYIRKNNTIWLERNGKLAIAQVILAYKDREFAYVTSGINEGDNMIISNIITPINGMDVKLQDHE